MDPIGQPACVCDRWAPPSVEASGLLRELFSIGFASRISFQYQFACLKCMTVVPGAVFWLNPLANTDSPSWNLLV